MKFIHAAALSFAVSTLALAPSAFADRPGESKHQAKIPMAEAMAKALSLVPGTLIAEELEHERGRWIYSFEIKPRGETRKIIREVNIDADTGAVVGIETERD
jgi:uncharacterized membrane protein YkoI